MKSRLKPGQRVEADKPAKRVENGRVKVKKGRWGMPNAVSLVKLVDKVFLFQELDAAVGLMSARKYPLQRQEKLMIDIKGCNQVRPHFYSVSLVTNFSLGLRSFNHLFTEKEQKTSRNDNAHLEIGADTYVYATDPPIRCTTDWPVRLVTSSTGH